MTDNQAIKILQQQIDRLRNNSSNRSSAWNNETKRYIVEFFGENSIEYDRYWYFGAWWIINPAIDKSVPNTVEHQEKQVIALLESFINTIKNLGITRKPKMNFLYTIPNWILSLIFPALVLLGIIVGKYLDNVENIRLMQKSEKLELENKNLKQKITLEKK